MSHSEKPSEQKDETETEIHEDDKLHLEDRNGKDDQVKDLLKTSQTEKRSVSPLTLFKEDLSQFKEGLLKVLKDKDTNPKTTRPPEKPTGTLTLLKEDLSQFKEGLLKVLKDKDTNPKTTRPPEKPIGTLTLLKEDLNHLKEDISSIFRIRLSKEHEDKDGAAKLDSSNAVKIKATKAERSDESLLNLFKRGNLSKITPKTNHSQEVRKTLPVKAEEQTDNGFTNKNPISTEETNNNTTERLNDSDDSKLDANVSQEVTERRMQASEKVDQLSENGKGGHDSSGEEEEEEEPSETVQCPLMSRLTLIAVGNADKADLTELPGGHLWALKNFAYYLTLDPNTANSEILLTDSNRKATRVWSDHQYSEHPERFEFCPQVLCREGLLDKVYWEVEWRGGADIGVTYNNISRDGDTVNCLLGHNERSWTLECAEGSYTPCHNRKRLKSLSPENFTRRIGIYLNWPAGALSFYCVSQDMMVHLHTFSCTFTEPLYPGFWVWAYNGSVSLCHVELEWEHALK